jgi:hypothetical protein
MAIIDLPRTRAFQGATFSVGLDVSESTYTGALTGNRTRRSNLADRLRGSLALPPVRDAAEAGAREALLMGLRSNGDLLRMGMPHRLAPVGTLRGSPTVAASVLAGARSVSLANARAGANLLRSAETLVSLLATGWTTSNASITPSGAADPAGGTGGWTITRTATGNHFAFNTVTVASTALRTVSAYVWLKAGTLTGNVVLRLRDGADAEMGNATVTPTADWAVYRVAATFTGGAAANVRLYIDPANDAGSAGDTLQVWFSEVRVLTGVDTLCVAVADADAPPAGQAGGAEVVTRTGAGNAFSVWVYSTTAHALRTYTFSVWAKAGTFGGSMILRVRDGANAMDLATSTTALTGAWQRLSVTATFGAAPVAGIVVYMDQTDAGSIGETYSRYGVMLEQGGAAGDFSPWPTAQSGDYVSIGGNLLQVAYGGAVGDVTGAITLPLTMPAPRAITAGAVVDCTAPTGLWELDDEGLQLDYSAPVVQGGIAIPLRQVVL